MRVAAALSRASRAAPLRQRWRNSERAWTALALFGKFIEHQQEALMARAASKKSSKKRSAASSTKTGRARAQKGPAAKRGAPQKRAASKGRRRRQTGGTEWAGAFQTLIGSPQGREI